MLQAIRERAQGWIAWVIVILITIPFALWGIQEYLGIGAAPVAATVNGQEITQRELDQRFHQFKTELRERLGAAYQPELFDDTQLHAEVLDDMIRNILVLQASTDMGLRAGDEQVRATILSAPAFQKSGRFDKAAYERALRFQGLDSAAFEQRVRASLMTSQLSNVVSASELITDRELHDAIQLRGQQRDFSYFVLPVERFRDDAPVTDEEATAYYRAHEDAFRTPEQVKLDYLVLAQGAVGTNQEVDEETLRALYLEHRDEFRTPEQRRARHILLTLEDDAHKDAVRQKIEAIRDRLVAGEDFATLARELSQDPGSAAQGGDLGFFERGLMDPAFDSAVFSLSKGEISAPVRSNFGYHLIEVMDIQSESVKPFDEVKDRLVKLYQGGETEQHYFELAEQLGNLSYESPDSLVPAADALGLQLQHSDWIDRNGGEGELADPRVVAAAFSDDVLRQGNNSELIEVDGEGGQRAVVVRVTDHREASLAPLAEVMDRIEQAVRDERAEQAADAQARALLERLRGGESLAEVSSGYELQQPGLVGRDAEGVAGAVRSRVFTLPQPGAGAESYGVATLGDGSAVVIALSQVQDGILDAVSDQQQKTERRSLARSLARNYYQHMVDDLRQRADIKITGTGADE